jgi:glycosyltransferase involved in cell wall biosynthesis
MSVINEATHAVNPKISVLSFCLNSGNFLRETIGSILQQTYGNYEFIIKDGGSTDETIEILKEYPQIRWVSEKEDGDVPTLNILDAIWRAFHMSRGEYIIYLAVSDGISDPNWFKKAVDILDLDPEVSWVWGISQTKLEDGCQGRIFWQEYLEHAPPQKREWFPFWLALKQGQETNAIFRRSVFEKSFPKNDPNEPYRFSSTFGFNLRLNAMGYMPYFLPIISFYGHTHKGQLSERFYDLQDSVSKRYDRDVKEYRKKFLTGKIVHRFRDGASNVIHEVGKNELWHYRKKVLVYRLKCKLRRELQKLMDHIVY